MLLLQILQYQTQQMCHKTINSLIFVLLCCSLSSIQTKLPIQAHSFNDLDYLKNIINKGIDYFKLDISMANRQSCQQYSTWSSSSPCYNSSQYTEQICCLGMRGDASSRPNFKYAFNTTADLLIMLLNTVRNLQPNRKLLFAINFQYGFSFDDFLSKNFMHGIANLLEMYPDRLLIGTGSDNFILEYDRVCAVGSHLCDDVGMKISKSPIFLQTGSYNPYDPRDIHKRYRNFNIMFKGIESYCRDGFPTWVNKYPEFPLVFWQPSDQSQIQYTFNKFLEPSCMKKHNRTIEGMAIATNIDVQMFTLYMKKLVDISVMPQKQWNPKTNKILIQDLQNMHLTTTTKTNQKQTIIGISTNLTSKNTIFSKFQLTTQQNIAKLSTIRQIKIFAQNQQIQNIMNNGQQVVVVTNSHMSGNNDSAVYLFDYELDLVRYRTRRNSTVVASYYEKEAKLLYVVLKIEGMHGEGNNYYQIQVTEDLEGYRLLKEFNTLILVSDMTILNQKIILAGSDNTLSKLLILNKNDGKITYDNIILSHGSNPKLITKSPSSNNLKILLQNSMCHSAILINNNDMNKCTFHCQKQFNDICNVKGLINMIQGNLDDIIANTMEDKGEQCMKVIGPCHQKIRFSKIANGINSEAVDLEGGYSLLAMDYLRVEDQDFIGAVFCGGANYQKQMKGLQGTVITVTVSPYAQKIRYLRE